jgi:hypothetical protein
MYNAYMKSIRAFSVLGGFFLFLRMIVLFIIIVYYNSAFISSFKLMKMYLEP